MAEVGSPSPICDAHTHLGWGSFYSLMPEELVAKMDELGVAQAVVCPSDRALAYHFREGNATLIQAAQRYPQRLLPCLTASPWAEREGLRSIEEGLDAGMCGLKFNTALTGCFINDPKLYPYVEFAAAHELPVYFHTGTPIYALPTQLEALARRYPQVKFIMGHMGFADFWTDAVPVALATPNIYLETSHFAIAPILEQVMSLAPERVLFGSDAPVSTLALELAKIGKLNVPEGIRRKALGGNLLALLGRVA
ncbi:MAG: amidohydrolase family protein [Anaerolineae bacterium]